MSKQDVSDIRKGKWHLGYRGLKANSIGGKQSTLHIVYGPGGQRVSVCDTDSLDRGTKLGRMMARLIVEEHNDTVERNR